jgi:hypothetical protein
MGDGAAPDSPPRAKRMRVAAAAAGEGAADGGAVAAWPHRKPRTNLLGEWADAPAPALQPAWLVKTPLALPSGHPSPGALQGCRVALQARHGAAAPALRCAADALMRPAVNAGAA